MKGKGTWRHAAWVAGMVLALGGAVEAHAQQRGALGRQGGLRPPMPSRLQERLDTLVRTRLRLTEEQFAQLQGVATRLEEARFALRRDEMATRMRLRRALAGSESVDQVVVAQLLDEIPRQERRKVELLEQEQKELSQFLTPSQRARYMALQEELRRGMQEVQRRRLGREGAAVEGGMAPRRPPPYAGAPRVARGAPGR